MKLSPPSLPLNSYPGRNEPSEGLIVPGAVILIQICFEESLRKLPSKKS